MRNLIILVTFLIGCATVKPGDKGFYLYDSFEKSFKNDKISNLNVRINNQSINQNDSYMELFLNSLNRNLLKHGVEINNSKKESEINLNLIWNLDNNHQKEVGTKYLPNRQRIKYTLAISLLDTKLILGSTINEKPMLHIGQKFYSDTKHNGDESYEVESPESVINKASLFYSIVISAIFTPAKDLEGKWRNISDGNSLEFKRINKDMIKAEEEPTIGPGRFNLFSKDYWSQNTYQINEKFLIKGNAKIYEGTRIHVSKNTRTNETKNSNWNIKIVNVGNLFVIIPHDYFEKKYSSYEHFYILE